MIPDAAVVGWAPNQRFNGQNGRILEGGPRTRLRDR